MSKREEPPAIVSRKLVYEHRIPVSKTKVFWDGLKDGVLYATRCKKCGKIYYPPQADCIECLASDVEWVKLSSEGTLVTYTQNVYAPQGFTHYGKPYIIAIAETPEGVKVMGWLEGVDVRDAKVGMRVKITPKVQDDGFPVIVFTPL